MKSQSFHFHLFGKIKSMHRLLLIILCLATSTYDYSQQLAFLSVYREGLMKKIIYIFLLIGFGLNAQSNLLFKTDFEGTVALSDNTIHASGNYQHFFSVRH